MTMHEALAVLKKGNVRVFSVNAATTRFLGGDVTRTLDETHMLCAADVDAGQFRIILEGKDSHCELTREFAAAIETLSQAD